MKSLYFLIICIFVAGPQSWAQQEYFSDYNKEQGLIYFKKKIYNGCVALKEKQEPVTAQELKEKGELVVKQVNHIFSKAFKENPKVQKAFEAEVKKLSESSRCQRYGNDCRASLVGTAMYYMQQLRPDIEGCSRLGSESDKRCEVEEKYRKASLEGVRTHYGAIGPGSYKKELIATKNNALMDIFNTVMKKDKDNLHICDEVLSGLPYRYALDFEEEGEFNQGIDPDYNPNKKILKDCTDPKKSLYQEFYPTSLDNRSYAGADLVAPIKLKIEEFIKSHPEMLITDVSVVVLASHHPHIEMINGKKGINPESTKKSLAQASEKLMFVQQALQEIEKSNTQFTHIKFHSQAKISGPEFKRTDLNDRFVTKMTPGYFERVKRLFEENKEEFKKDALIDSHTDLVDERKFTNLYQAKFKPFEGFRVEISGHVKSEMKCSSETKTPEQKKPISSKQ